VTLAVAWTHGAAVAQRGAVTASEYDIKAAYLYNFIALTEWPARAFPSPDAPLRVCIVGDDPFGSILERTVHGEVVNGRRMVIERFPPLERAAQCHVVFLSRRTAPRPVLDTLAASPVLTIGESEAVAQAGGTIVFVAEDGRIRFEVNRSAATRRGLTFNARLLEVAREVR
jgi:hypothetical protein